jgi:hypothetical protein
MRYTVPKNQVVNRPEMDIPDHHSTCAATNAALLKTFSFEFVGQLRSSDEHGARFLQ